MHHHRLVSTMSGKHPGFLPIAEGSTAGKDAAGRLHLGGIVFDMDGTLCEPQNYMFGEMRAALGIDKGIDILDHMHSLPEPQQSEAFDKIKEIERTAMTKQIPQAGLVTLMEALDRWGVKKGICTRNFDAPVTHLLQKHLPSHVSPFTPIITRDFKPPKPSPAGILHIAHAWGLVDSAEVPSTPVEERHLPLIMVGDSVDDMASGRDAGALTVLLASVGKGQSEELVNDERSDVVVYRLDELVGLIEEGIVPRSRE
ncbi:hypothetical protein CLAFUW4_04617 [Fulvia fulva]|uniref:Uncharacterized protein n=1 Tax=Passalora fulva TaxID=5499 RepID=A0A9Q8P884_PASFU|nr:uncharacterized protein CLAFUR5_04577 [Fulvia fulva]KAK4626187.1 hypothetical protein CLAFUR4_04603 [Fulvia fulva]KAK4628458.1 hypothetical protein CLAFUR0_04605 [Fulvia fulva]UJO16843.1 hypothetical protein CLAFUR5_04577 [Fulvia fulva]WPV13411.1 hypothetical protein CLAFUW4_04617 [Fulvia fulva]WPV28329.1 hypothetical protein CLAFUW7_04609 [Fulvia fulva]